MSLSSTKRTTSKLRIADVHALSSEEVQRVILNRWRAGAITSLLSRVLLFQIARAKLIRSRERNIGTPSTGSPKTISVSGSIHHCLSKANGTMDLGIGSLMSVRAAMLSCKRG